MSYIAEHKAKFDNLVVSLELKNREQLKRKANGGNSIVFTYPPDEEMLYIEKAKELNKVSNQVLEDMGLPELSDKAESVTE